MGNDGTGLGWVWRRVYQTESLPCDFPCFRCEIGGEARFSSDHTALSPVFPWRGGGFLKHRWEYVGGFRSQLWRLYFVC